MREADGEFLDTLYRLIDVDKGLDKIHPETKLISKACLERPTGLHGIRARLFIASHLDQGSSCGEKPFLSWSKALEGVRYFQEKKKGMIRTSEGRLKPASSQLVVAIDLRTCLRHL